jgi:hypothetical protein
MYIFRKLFLSQKVFGLSKMLFGVTWGVAPYPTSLLKKAGSKTFMGGYRRRWKFLVLFMLFIFI